ncbi:MAG: hemolysin III family protein [Solirubrobacteraceae bacterium]|nr:hemolysin III family protein [Solirubrobacteraceae bacterium]
MTERIERLRDAGADAVERGQEAAARRVDATREAASRRMSAAQGAATRKVQAARAGALEMRDQAAAAAAKVKPRLRGVIHEYAFFVAIVLGALLVWRSQGGVETAAMTVYAAGICGLFGVSALYHRVTWRPRARAWMRRLDHSMIFVFIAATFTPFALLVLEGSLATLILCIVWGGALAGIVLSLLWIGAPKWVSVVVYLALGLVGATAAPEIAARLGWLALGGIALGGALYAAGAVIYATGRPNPKPSVFGYHEVFHTLVTGAAASHYAVIAFAVLPLAR